MEKVIEKSSTKNQYFATFVVNLLTLGYGAASGWASPNLKLLLSDDSPLPTGKITMEEASWIASYLCIGSLFGNLFFGFVTNAYGRKEPLLAIAVPSIISWFLILYAQNVQYFYVARMLAGFASGGIFLIVPIYVSEIADDKVRGQLGSFLVLVCNFGLVLGFIFGAYCDFEMTPRIIISAITVFFILFCFFPESPSFLIKQDRLSEAVDSLRFYQNLQVENHEQLHLQINTLKSNFEKNFEKSEDKSLRWSDFTKKEAKKALLIGVVLVTLSQCSGCFALINYTANIFEEAGSSLSPNESAIIVGVIQLIGSYFPIVLADRAGRKFLLSVSAIGTALGLISMGMYSWFQSSGNDLSHLNWIPLTSFSFIMFIASWGVLSLPFLVIAEILPEKLKNVGILFCTALISILSFIMVKFLPFLTETLGMHGSMFLFASVCLLSAVFILLVMPETKGRSHEEIMKSLQ